MERSEAEALAARLAAELPSVQALAARLLAPEGPWVEYLDGFDEGARGELLAALAASGPADPGAASLLAALLGLSAQDVAARLSRGERRDLMFLKYLARLGETEALEILGRLQDASPADWARLDPRYLRFGDLGELEDSALAAYALAWYRDRRGEFMEFDAAAFDLRESLELRRKVIRCGALAAREEPALREWSEDIASSGWHTGPMPISRMDEIKEGLKRFLVELHLSDRLELPPTLLARVEAWTRRLE